MNTGDVSGYPIPPRDPALDRLEAFVGTWATEGEVRATASRPARTFRAADVYEWLPGRFFLVHRWDAQMPDGSVQGIEIIGYDPASATYSVHPYDSWGSATVMRAIADDRTWTFISDQVRFRGQFSADGKVFSGLWERREEAGGEWVPWMDVRLQRMTEGVEPSSAPRA